MSILLTSRFTLFHAYRKKMGCAQKTGLLTASKLRQKDINRFVDSELSGLDGLTAGIWRFQAWRLANPGLANPGLANPGLANPGAALLAPAGQDARRPPAFAPELFMALYVPCPVLLVAVPSPFCFQPPRIDCLRTSPAHGAGWLRFIPLETAVRTYSARPTSRGPPPAKSGNGFALRNAGLAAPVILSTMATTEKRRRLACETSIPRPTHARRNTQPRAGGTGVLARACRFRGGCCMRARCSHGGDIFQSAEDAERTESDRRDSMRYIVTLSKEADAEILSILSYIAVLSQSHDTALESALAQLANAPHSGSLPRCAPRIRRGYRVLAVDKCLLFHTIDDAAGRVLLHHIFDSRAAYQ